MQQLRPSQYITTYGPGSILEGQQGPRIIPRPEVGLFRQQASLQPEDFEISDQRMSRGLLGGARIFRLPSNAELGLSETRYVYRTRPFPSWSLCLALGHGGSYGILYHVDQCPVCRSRGRRRQESIRFVRACPEGHLDDVHWPHVVHQRSQCSQSDWFQWHGGGGSLRQIWIECPTCHSRGNLGQIYSRPWPCSGRLPEREELGEFPRRPGCTTSARIIQRQASNLRIPELRSLFTIPPRATRLHNLLQHSRVFSNIAGRGEQGFRDENDLAELLRNLVKFNLVPQTVVEEILDHSWEQIQHAMQELLLQTPFGFHELLTEEFQELQNASRNAYPPVYVGRMSRPIFEVNPENVIRLPLCENLVLRITPITRLQTITVQVGYRREISSPGRISNLVPVSFRDGQGDEWYPGVRFLGEGLFITLDDDRNSHFPLVSSASSAWLEASQGSGNYPSILFRDPTNRTEIHPVFVWWHTFSHLLIRAISIDSGYSSAAMRERVYVQTQQDGGHAWGGTILYATQPGTEGSLGGLIALVPHLHRTLHHVLDMARACSNDPLCLDKRFQLGGHTGPACYSCLLLSETSCEHRNLWLDRELFLDNLT